MANVELDSSIAARQERWDQEISARLPGLLDELRSSAIYGAAADRRRPPETYGVYLFSERGEPRYVGRVGLTERSRLAGKRFSNFRTRLNGHTSSRKGRPRHNEATYAYKRTCDEFRRRGLPLARTRTANCENATFLEEFTRQVEAVRNMDFQVVEILDDRLQAVFEIYAATVLELDQSFAVS